MTHMRKLTAATAAFAVPAMMLTPTASALTIDELFKEAFSLPTASAASTTNLFAFVDGTTILKQNDSPNTVSEDTNMDRTYGSAKQDSTPAVSEGDGGSMGAAEPSSAPVTTESSPVQQPGTSSTPEATGSANEQDGLSTTAPATSTPPASSSSQANPPATQAAPTTSSAEPVTPSTTQEYAPGYTATPETPAYAAPSVEAAPQPMLPVTGGSVDQAAWVAGAVSAIALAAGAAARGRRED